MAPGDSSPAPECRGLASAPGSPHLHRRRAVRAMVSWRCPVELLTVPIDKPEELNVILGQSHFIKTV